MLSWFLLDVKDLHPSTRNGRKYIPGLVQAVSPNSPSIIGEDNSAVATMNGR